MKKFLSVIALVMVLSLSVACFASCDMINSLLGGGQQGGNDDDANKVTVSWYQGSKLLKEEKIDKGTPVAWLDDDAKDLYHVHLTEGRYPEAKGEIAIEKDAALRLGIKPVVGEEISVSMLTANSDSFLTTSTDKTYTVVGILTDKRKNYENFLGAVATLNYYRASFQI